MDIQECKDIIRKEQLINYNMFNDHESEPNEVCIRKVDDSFIVFVMSERCSPIDASIKKFLNESDALESFIRRLRATKRLASRQKS